MVGLPKSIQREDALFAWQDWSGLWRFAYSHVERGLADGYGAPHLFDLSVDPVNLASERAVMCLFLRGDMAPLETKVTLDVGAPRLTPDGKPAANRPEWMDEAWRLQVGRIAGDFSTKRRRDAEERECSQTSNATIVHKSSLSTNDTNINANVANVEVLPMPVPNVANAGQDWKLNLDTGNISTMATFSNGSAPLRLCVENNPATVFATSLDGVPLETSSRILVTHLTDAQAEGNVFADRARSILLKWGKGRTLVRNGAARVSLALDHPESCEVWGLATDGARMERVPAAAENGRLSFTAEVDSGRGARMFYEIARKSDP